MDDQKYSFYKIYLHLFSQFCKQKEESIFKEFISLFMAASYYLIRNKDPEYIYRLQKT